jgi:hypothetical protein
MASLKRKSDTLLSRLSNGFSHGLAQMAGGALESHAPPYKSRSSAEALRGDWVRVGGDFGRAMDGSYEGLNKRRAYREKA